MEVKAWLTISSKDVLSSDGPFVPHAIVVNDLLPPQGGWECLIKGVVLHPHEDTDDDAEEEKDDAPSQSTKEGDFIAHVIANSSL